MLNVIEPSITALISD